MDRARVTEMVARNIGSEIEAAGLTPESVAKATDVPLSSLLAGSEMSLDELGRVGGLLHVPSDRFFCGVTA
jgi:hypothetical protein